MPDTKPPEPWEFDPAEAVTNYRGYRIELRLHGACGTYRVRRADGSWRYIRPASVGPYHQEWVILGPVAEADPPELGTAVSVEDARRRIDAIVGDRDQ